MQNRPRLAIGDALTECEAALSLGIAFLGITPPNHDAGFPPEVPQLRDLGEVLPMLGIA